MPTLLSNITLDRRPRDRSGCNRGTGPRDSFCHARAAAALLGGLLPVLVGLPPPPAHANDRDLRGTVVPASACTATSAGAPADRFFDRGAYVVDGSSELLVLICPLPVNNVDLSGTANDNDISKFRVYYLDSDGSANSAGLSLFLNQAVLAVDQPSGHRTTDVCRWFSNPNGGGIRTATRSTFPCAHDVSSAGFYFFQVFLSAGPGTTATFLGIDFPP
jgi:hypothetical protein